MRPENEKSSPGTRAIGKVVRLGVALRRQPVDRRSARIAEPEQPRALVERLAGRVVERRAHDVEPAVIPDVEEQRVPAAREQAEERRVDGSGCRNSEATWPCRWLTGASGSRRAHASAFAADSPTRSAPISPGPCVTATRSTRSSPTPASPSASRRTGVTSSRCRRDATSGTTPPYFACSSAWEETTLAQDLAVVRDDRRGRLVAGRLEPEDQALAGSRTGSRHMISASSRLSV